MKHIKLRNSQQFDGEFTDLFILGTADLTTNTAGVWSKGSDFTAAATTQTFTLLKLAIGDLVHNAALMYVETALAGPSISAATLSIGVTSATTQFINAADVFTNAVAAGGAFANGTTGLYITVAASKSLLATLTTTGANASVMTAGRVWIYTKISRVVDFMGSPTGNRFE